MGGVSGSVENILGSALDCEPGREYDERAFRYFLALERARARVGHHSLRLLLATLEPAPGRPVIMDALVADRLFAGLRLALRETDVTGWYRQGHVAAAVLCEPAPEGAADVARMIQRRVIDGLRQRLPSHISPSLRVRAIELRPRFSNA
jgi:hypothetical protein